MCVNSYMILTVLLTDVVLLFQVGEVISCESFREKLLYISIVPLSILG